LSSSSPAAGTPLAPASGGLWLCADVAVRPNSADLILAAGLLDLEARDALGRLLRMPAKREVGTAVIDVACSVW